MTEEHPFAQFVRIIGKGPHLSRPLTEDEMTEATRMILTGDVEPVQLGAFLCVLRVRTEEPAEAAGFVRAVRESLDLPANSPSVDLDWPAYAGKKRQLPWFVLAALLLAENGVRVFMHGAEGHTPGRVYVSEALSSLGLSDAGSLADAASRLEKDGFAYLQLGPLSPRLQEIMEFRPLLGLRSPVHTFARMINPFAAACSLQAVFHPGYRDVHREAAQLLGQPHMVVFKGEGGEGERRPEKPAVVQALRHGEMSDEEWPIMLHENVTKDESMDLRRLSSVWRGEENSPYATGAIVGTVAIVLRLMGRADSPEEAQSAAQSLWSARNLRRFGTAI